MATIEEIRAKPEADRTPEEKAMLTAADAKQSDNKEHMIPKSRLDEVIAEREAARKEALELKEKQDKANQAALVEQGKWKELAEQREKELNDVKSKADKVDGYEKTLKETLDVQVAELPPDLRNLLPEELTTAQKLTWLSKNKATLLKTSSVQDIGAGARGGGKPETKIDLTPQEIAAARDYGMTAEEYVKFRDGAPEPFTQQDKKS